MVEMTVGIKKTGMATLFVSVTRFYFPSNMPQIVMSVARSVKKKSSLA
jgi:hypothetical protein